MPHVWEWRSAGSGLNGRANTGHATARPPQMLREMSARRIFPAVLVLEGERAPSNAILPGRTGAANPVKRPSHRHSSLWAPTRSPRHLQGRSSGLELEQTCHWSLAAKLVISS